MLTHIMGAELAMDGDLDQAFAYLSLVPDGQKSGG